MTKYYFFKGTVHYASLTKLDKFGRYSLTINLDQEDINKFNQSGIQKSLKGTDAGPQVTFTRVPSRLNPKTNEIIQFGAPRVLDKHGEATNRYVMPGDEIVCKVSTYNTTKGIGSSLEAVLLLNKEGNFEPSDPEYDGPRF